MCRRLYPIVIMTLGALLVLSACIPQDADLPTLADIDVIANATALQLTQDAPTPTDTPVRLELPPTFTPTPTDVPTATPLPSPTPRPTGGATGTIYYTYNGDSVAVATLDGLTNDILITLGVNVPITHLTLAPDGQSFAYVAPDGDAREVFVSNLSATNIQRVTCLNYRHIEDITWTPDSQSLTVLASPNQGDPRNIYLANVRGNVTCPAGNQQRRIVEVNTPRAQGLTWHPADQRLFFSTGDFIAVHDMPTGVTTPYTRGVQDFSPVHSPTTDRLAYLATLPDNRGRMGGALVIIEDTTFIPDTPRTSRATPYNANRLTWSPDGSLLLVMTPNRLILIGASVLRDIEGIPLDNPNATFSPDSRYIAFSARDATNDAEQIFIHDIRTQRSTALTDHPIGEVGAILWSQGDLP